MLVPIRNQHRQTRRSSSLWVGLFFIFQLAFTSNTHAALSFQATVSFSKGEILEGQNARIYANLGNILEDTKGVVKFFDGIKQIGPDQPFSVLKGKTVDVFTDYERVPYGERTIIVKVYPWNKGNQSVTGKATLYADRDSDGDGMPDRKDEDDDNDKTLDARDAFPINPKETTDSDGDKVGDNADTDDDNDDLEDGKEAERNTDPKSPDTDRDKTLDARDAFPLDPREWMDHDQDGTGDNADPDDDNDGTEDIEDQLPFDAKETRDMDSDKIGDESDSDIDGDGVSNMREKEIMTDPRNADTDGDEKRDGEDRFPLDPREWNDRDHDGMGDNGDSNSNNPGPVIDADMPSIASVLWPYHFSAERSSDPNGRMVSLSWIMDGHAIERREFWYFFAMPGKHEVVIEAVDDQNEKRTVKKTINVSGVPYVVVLGGMGSIVLWQKRKRRK